MKAGARRRPKSRPKAKAKARRPGLTEYESEQVDQIAAWKSAHPNPFGELFKAMTVPVAKVVETVIPDTVARSAIETVYQGADFAAGEEDIKRRAGVKDLAGLHKKPLEECDRLASSVGVWAEAIGLVEGAATGFGGMATTVLDVPLLFTHALRTIIKIGHCYGYALDREADRSYVLQILIIAASGSSAVRMERLKQLREIEDWALREAQEMIVTEEAASFLFQLEEFEEVPGIGAISGGLFNFTFMRKVEVAARRIFQERWLRDQGKVDVIEPAPVDERVPSGAGFFGALGRATYRGCYYLGFGATWPMWAVVALVPVGDNALTRGLREGASAATEGAQRLVGRAGGKAALAAS